MVCFHYMYLRGKILPTLCVVLCCTFLHIVSKIKKNYFKVLSNVQNLLVCFQQFVHYAETVNNIEKH